MRRAGMLPVLLLAVVLPAGMPGHASAQETMGLPPAPQEYDADLERRTEQLASQLRCPVCQGLSVEDSPTELALQMRAVVREQLAAGRSPDEVKAYFVDKYGEWILLEPKPHGFNLVVYVLPWLAVAIGVGVIVLAVRRWTAAGQADTESDGAAVDSLETASRDL